MTKIFGAAIVVLAAAAACTEVDDRLGQNLLPSNQRMKVEVTTYPNRVETRLYRTDSVPSSRLGVGYIGRMSDDAGVFGAQTNSVVLQFVPYSLPYKNVEGYGLDPIIDSMRIMLSLTGVRGDTLREQTFEVYDLRLPSTKKRLHRDSIYYNSFPVDEYKNQKLFEFVHRGKRNIRARLRPTEAGRKFMDSLVHLGWANYKTDSLFFKKFQGLYITPAPGGDPLAAVYGFNPGSSYLELTVRNHDTIDRRAIYDTVQAKFIFRDSDYVDDQGNTTKWDNVSINMARFDYAGSAIERLHPGPFKDIPEPGDPTQTRAYIQTMAGVGTQLRFPEAFVEELRELGKEDDKEKYDIMINQAMMQIPLAANPFDYYVLDASIPRLGSYRRISKLAPIPDYQYLYELKQQSAKETASYVLPYGGYLNRSNGFYELDITAQIQGLAIKDHKDASPVMLLAPSAFGFYSFGGSAMQGYDPDWTPSSTERPISIRLTYTKIEK